MKEITLHCDRLYKRGLYRNMKGVPKRQPAQPAWGRGKCQKTLARDGQAC